MIKNTNLDARKGINTAVITIIIVKAIDLNSLFDSAYISEENEKQ